MNDDQLLELLRQSVDKDKVREAIKGRPGGNLNPPELINFAAIVLGTCVKTSRYPCVALQYFSEVLTERLPGLAILVKEDNHVDRGTDS